MPTRLTASNAIKAAAKEWSKGIEDEPTTNFKKNDDGKLQWSKFCWRAAAKVLQVMHYGADKYGWDNWRKAQSPEDRRRYLDASFRHMTDYMKGEILDSESGKPHLWHAACSLLFFLEYDDVKSTKINDEQVNTDLETLASYYAEGKLS